MKYREIFILFLIVLIGFILRLYKINRPIADWHSWRQADTAAVARNFIKEGFNPLVPRFDDMSSQTNTLDNPNGYRFVEFPIYNSLIAFVWNFTGVNVLYARLTTVMISLISTIFLYYIVRHFSGKLTAFLSAFFFATIPYNIFYSSSILPGPFMVFAILGLYLVFIKYLHTEKIIWLFSTILFANLAILSWPIAIFFIIPTMYLAIQKYGFSVFKKIDLYIIAILSLLPFIAWRIWMTNFPEGIPNWQFLINEGNIRFKGAFFRWLIAERMGKLILTLGGFTLFVLGLINKNSHKEGLFYLSWLFSVVLYFVVFASGNVRHDYYQVPFIPIAAIFMAKGVGMLIEKSNKFINIYIGYALAVILFLITIAFGYFEVKGFYWVNKPEIIEAGQEADRILPKDATVIAPYNGDTAFLYQINRHGYPLVDRPLEKFIDQGTRYFISVDVTDNGIKNLAKNCKVIKQSNTFVILELSKDCIGK